MFGNRTATKCRFHRFRDAFGVKAVSYHGTHATTTASTKSPRLWGKLATAHVKGSHVYVVMEALVGADVPTGIPRTAMVTIDLWLQDRIRMDQINRIKKTPIQSSQFSEV